MVFTGSLQLAHGVGLCKNPNHRHQFKGGLGRSELHVLDLKLSSRVLFQQHKSLSFHVSDSVYRPLHNLPYRHNAFTCRSFLPPSGTLSELPRLKIAASALTRSFNVLQGSPHLPKLAIAAGITAFAAWGFLPLVHLIRNLILHKKDNGWKKSKTHYIMTSYIQPLLLWIGSLLICRALDPVFLPTETGQIVKERLLNFVRSLSTVLAFAYCLSGVIQQTQKFFIETNDSNDTRNMGFHFAGKAVYSAVWIAAFALFMELLGFSTQKWVTAGGLGTVLLTLAGREIFTNFLSSAMIHATRPFVVNEWIQTKIQGYDVSGTVEHVGWWSPTIVRGEDREAVHIPNHKFTVNVVRNLTQKTHWRIKTHLAISHSDVHKINIIVADMRKVLSKNPHVEQQRLHRRVFLENINPENQALMILISCFVKTSHYEEYLGVKETILLDLLRVVSHHRARLATPIRTVQKIYSDIDLENIPFADSVYTRGGVPNRPLLLIEPSYKVNGEDKTKTRTVKPNGEQPKTTARSPLTNEITETENKADEKIGKTKNTNGEQKLDKKVELNIGATPASKLKNGETLTPENKDVKTGQRMENDSKDDTKTTKSDSKTDSKITNPNSESATPPKIPRSGNQKSPTTMSSSSSETSTEKSASKSKNGEILTSGNKDIKTGQKIETKVDDPKMAKSNSKIPNLDPGSDTTPPKISRSGNQKIPTNLSPESGTEKLGGSSTAPIPIQNSKLAIPKPALEENIVLGVALEGSKRTLPIEEETAPPLEEVTESSCRLGQGSSSDKDNKKEGQNPSFPSSTSPDQ